MTRFAVWAPQAREGVALVAGGRPVPMAPAAGGWYALEVPAGAGSGTEYRFALDGGPPLADPRSPWQPHGIDGPSRAVDHSAHTWTDAGWRGATMAWLSGGAIYELHVGTFTPEGTFEAAIAHLDHLVALGVRAVELMPVAEFSGDHGWGYDGVFLFAPHHAYGGPEGLKRLVDACHRAGLAVLIDVVYNHLGPAGNVLAQFGPYFTDRYATPWGSAVNLDGPGSDEVRRFFIDNVLMWLRDYHADGLRIDAVHAIVDTSAVHLLEEMAGAVAGLEGEVGRSLVLIAESDLNDPRVVRPEALGGYGLDGVWNEDFHHALHAALTGEQAGYYQDFGPLSDVCACLERGAVYDGRVSRFRGRRHGRPFDGVAGRSFVGFVQNHDQVGNRAVGDRLAALVPIGRLKIAAALVVLSPFVPMVFMGEEWGASTPFQYFTDHRDPELGAAVSSGRRREFAAFAGMSPDEIPDPQDPATFERSKLRWAELGEPAHGQLLTWHRSLLELRRSLPDLAGGPLSAVEASCRDDAEERWIRMRRGAVEVAANLGPALVELPVPGQGRLALVSAPGISLVQGRLSLPPDTVAVVVGT
ncbi:MAG TPA: malto-oligosyltrehalose trehalohydrolase [Actinomycetota bacterium]|nr:malto-oligosyltrehalose trehalohydrolase [Actinomycetota bacterium]